MARIEKPAVFQTNEVPNSSKESGESWRTFKSSLAITFTSKRHPTWDPEALTAEARSQIIRAIEARQSLAAAEMSVSTAMRELVEAASDFPPRPLEAPACMPPKIEMRKAAMRIALEAEARAFQREHLAALFTKVEEESSVLDLLVNGFVEVCEERSGNISMTFSLGRRIKLGLPEMEREARRLRHLLRNEASVLISARNTLAKTGKLSRTVGQAKTRLWR